MIADQMPHSPNAELAVINAVLLDPEEFKRVNIYPDDFFIVRYRWVWEAIRQITSRGDLPDYVTLGAELDARGQLQEIGGPAFLMGLINGDIDSWNATGYASIVKDRARRRNIIRALGYLAGKAYDESSNIEEHVSKCIDQLSRQALQSKGAVHISEVCSELLDEMERAHANPQDTYGIPTGFLDWDKITRGIQPGTVVLLTGEPGIGKSLLGAQVIINAAKKGYPGAYYSLEMGALQIIRRSVSQAAKVSPQTILSGRVSEDEVKVLVDAVAEMSELPIYISSCSEMTTMDLRIDLQRLKDEHGIRLVVIDYEALLTDSEGWNDIDRSTVISRRVHGIAKDLDLAILSIGDMVKAGMTGERRGQAAAAGSGKSLHDRDEIMIMRTDDGDQEIVFITWEKNREGSAKRGFKLLRAKGYPAFLDLKANAQRPGEKHV